MDKKIVSLEESIIQVGLRIAKRGEGALFVIGDVEYKKLINQNVPPFKAVSNPKLLESLALIDGAVIIDLDGMVKAYGAMVKSNSAFKNFGTRHSAALSASRKKGNTAIIISEEDKKVRIFKEGKMVMQIDALQKNVEKNVPHAIRFLESIGAGTVGTIGASIVAPALGLALLPGVVIFGSAYFLGRVLTDKFGKK